MSTVLLHVIWGFYGVLKTWIFLKVWLKYIFYHWTSVTPVVYLTRSLVLCRRLFKEKIKQSAAVCLKLKPRELRQNLNKIWKLVNTLTGNLLTYFPDVENMKKKKRFRKRFFFLLVKTSSQKLLIKIRVSLIAEVLVLVPSHLEKKKKNAGGFRKRAEDVLNPVQTKFVDCFFL